MLSPLAGSSAPRYVLRGQRLLCPDRSHISEGWKVLRFSHGRAMRSSMQARYSAVEMT